MEHEPLIWEGEGKRHIVGPFGSFHFCCAIFDPLLNNTTQEAGLPGRQKMSNRMEFWIWSDFGFVQLVVFDGYYNGNYWCSKPQENEAQVRS